MPSLAAGILVVVPPSVPAAVGTLVGILVIVVLVASFPASEVGSASLDVVGVVSVCRLWRTAVAVPLVLVASGILVGFPFWVSLFVLAGGFARLGVLVRSREPLLAALRSSAPFAGSVVLEHSLLGR